MFIRFFTFSANTQTRQTGAATEAGWKPCCAGATFVKVRGSHTEEKKAVRMQW
jgi:hypothetical protein